MVTTLHRGVQPNDYSITKGGYAQMITILHRGGGRDYVICARPLIETLLSLYSDKG